MGVLWAGHDVAWDSLHEAEIAAAEVKTGDKGPRNERRREVALSALSC